MEETSLASLVKQTRRPESEIVMAADRKGIPVRYSLDGRVFYPDEVRAIYSEIFPDVVEKTVDVGNILAMYPAITKGILRNVERKVKAERWRDASGVMVYSSEDARKVVEVLEDILRKDIGQAYKPEWWPVVDDYCFLTEVNNAGPIYRAVRDRPYKPIMDGFLE